MFFWNRKPRRLYYPTSSRWYTKPRNGLKLSNPRKVFTNNIRTHFTRLFKNAVYFTITGAILVVLIIILVFSSYLSITSIDVVRENPNIDTAAISNELKGYLGSNILFFNSNNITAKVQEKFPEFESVEVNKIFPHTIKVNLKSYPIVANLKAYYILPKVEPAITEQEGKTIKEVQEALETAFSIPGEKTVEKEELNPIEQKCLLNSIGQAIFDQEEDLELITITIDNLTEPIQDRQMIMKKEHMDYISDAIRYFNNTFPMQVKSVRYLGVAREIHITADNNIVVWLTFEKDYKEQLDKLNTIYKAAELDKEDIAYIDLRVKEKVIYCPARSRCNTN
jgi:cell division septal protein FtsQ